VGLELPHLGGDDAVTVLSYETLPVPDRIVRLRRELFATETTWCFERARLVTKSYQATEGEPTVLRRARALAKVFDEMPILIRSGELIVGQRAGVLAGRAVYPEYRLSGLTEATTPPEIWNYWRGRTIGGHTTGQACAAASRRA